MTPKTLGAAATALLLVSAVQAQAQTRHTAAAAPAAAPSAAASAPINHGPAIPGVCIFSHDAALGTSTVGRAFETRFQQIRAQAAAEVSGEESSLRTDIQAFQAKRASLTQEQQQQTAAPLQQREQALQQKASQLQTDLEYTGRVQIQRIDQAIEPIVRSIYEQRHCSLLLTNGVLVANPAMDITDAVVAQLNTRMTTITFDRQSPPAGAQ